MSPEKRHASQTRRDEHLRVWRESGLSQRAYCRQHDLHVQTFNSWVSHVKRSSSELPSSSSSSSSSSSPPPPTIVPVVVQPAAANDINIASSVSLHHRSGWQLQFPADVSANWLGHMLRNLA